MNHLEVISNKKIDVSDSFHKRATGRYYTHQFIANQIISTQLIELQKKKVDSLKVADPFAGDGRLVVWLIEAWQKLKLPKIHWEVYLFDINSKGLKDAERQLEELKVKGIDVNYHVQSGDSFKICELYNEFFDFVITNPPWELLKPDSRELKDLDPDIKISYINNMKDYDQYLKGVYSESQPLRKFAGWGTNLSRVGAELSFNICKNDGYISLVVPASFFADDQSVNIRKKYAKNGSYLDIAYYPAEAKLFGKADVPSASFSFLKSNKVDLNPKVTIFNKDLSIKSSEVISFSEGDQREYTIPITIGSKAINLLKKMKKKLPAWSTLEKEEGELWSGREIDETGSKNWLSLEGKGPKFIKGKMIGRYKIVEDPYQYINKDGFSFPIGCNFKRIAWRDVSRASQKRRVVATIIGENIVAGNSLGTAYYKDNDENSLYGLLAVFNSLCFEFQLRCHLATGHISLSSIRKVHIPTKKILSSNSCIAKEVIDNLSGVDNSYKIEALVAKNIYLLTKSEFSILINTFDKLAMNEKEALLNEYMKIPVINDDMEEEKIKIPNHHSSKLSELDMAIVHSVPPGGNWKNIPESIPSKRIAQIRQSYAEGKGSRSTYYGRLLASRPSYTINTYFNRPGNGCHIHYSQDRVLSQREAARLQSFPDDFVFYGSQTAVNTQIGNAVPPLLSYQVAQEVTKATGGTGFFIDLFSGAGGLGLGFKWAGWEPLLANDIEKRCIETYTKNVHSNAITGSITDPEVFCEIVNQCKKFKKENPNLQLWILGGPPCQGFSTAGNKRSMEDQRNTLFVNYKELLEEVSPDGFVFENVSGLLNMDKGEVFARVQSEFKTVMPSLTGWVLNSEEYAIPQRRKRVVLVGSRFGDFKINKPKAITCKPKENDLFSDLKEWISVEEALSDLPELCQGENGSRLEYRSQAKTSYQKFMKGLVSPEKYLSEFVESGE